MSSISELHPNLEIFRRQYLQLVPISQLRYPPVDVLKRIEVQNWLFSNLFDDNATLYVAPSTVYRLQVLKELLARIEDAFIDPDKDVRNDAITLFV
jgi:protein-lysine N-methyltransferase EEF2KMT